MTEAMLLLVAVLAVAETETPALTLREAVERAAARAPEVASAAASRAEAEAAGRLAAGGSRTGLTLHTDPAYVAGVPGPVLGRLPTIAGVELRGSFYDPDRRIEAEEARASLARAQGELALARSRAAEQAAVLFARCRAGDAAVAAAEARVRARQSGQDRAARLRQEGRATELDERRSRLGLAQAQQELRRARSDRELDGLALRRLLGLPADASLALAGEGSLPEPGGDGADGFAAARAADPLLRALADQAAAEERAVRIRGRLFSPVLEASAGYSRLYKTADWDEFYRTFKPDSWSLGASINLPLFASGRSAEEARARARLDRLGAERAARERELELEVRRAQESLAQAREGIEVARLAEAVGVEDLRVTRALFTEGRLDPADVAEKEQSLAEARRDLALAEADLVAAQARGLALRGELVQP